MRSRSHLGLLLGVLLAGFATSALASELEGTIEVSGQLLLPAPIPGIALEDVVVAPGTETEPTGSGEKCEILATESASAAVDGSYPGIGFVRAQLRLERGGPQEPTGGCWITLGAVGSDGAGLSARGRAALLVPADSIAAGGALTQDIVVRPSPSVAGLEDDCRKWFKKHWKSRDRCNALILKKGSVVAAERCKDAGPAPESCDPGLHLEAALALAHGMNDQQVDPAAGEAVDRRLLKPQLSCQKRLGAAAFKYTTKRLKGVQKKCVVAAVDSAACREEQGKAARPKLDGIDKCQGDVAVDPSTGRPVPDLGAPCDACIDPGGAVDTKCVKACFRQVLDGFSDGVVGDVPVCGDGIAQGGEFCDDGNTTDGDGCSALCGLDGP